MCATIDFLPNLRPSCFPVPDPANNNNVYASARGIGTSHTFFSAFLWCRFWLHCFKMALRLRSLVAIASLPLALAQSPTANSTFSAPSISAAPIATVLADTGYIPSALIDVAATYVASAANAVQTQLIEILSKPGSDPEKLNDPELYYTYGHSPPVYPSRMQPYFHIDLD